MKAQDQLREVILKQDLQVYISQLCTDLNVDGLRGDIVTNRASCALAAFENRLKVTLEDVHRVVTLCLRHRIRKNPFESVDMSEKVDEIFTHVFIRLI